MYRPSGDMGFRKLVLDYDDFVERDQAPQRYENSVRIPFITR